MTALVIFFFVSFAAGPAHAYVDPGTGTIILQMIIGGVAGALFALKLYWVRVKGFFERFSAKNRSVDDESQ